MPLKRLAGVLVLLFERAGELRVLLTTRSKNLRSHPGETALPGGKKDDTDSSFVITIDDTSPTIVYSPFADTFAAPNLTAGWNPFFSVSGFLNQSGPAAEAEEGSTFHVTSADGASLGIRWNGE